MVNEVIIDGCNVAECEWMIDGKDVIGCNSYICCCEEINNCYFKQLQRAKAEITHWSGLANEANERATEYGNECNKLIEEISELKAENEKLKAEIKKLSS